MASFNFKISISRCSDEDELWDDLVAPRSDASTYSAISMNEEFFDTAALEFVTRRVAEVMPKVYAAVVQVWVPCTRPSLSAVIDGSGYRFDTVHAKFEALARVWSDYKQHQPYAEHSHSAYMQVVGLGMAVVPCLLRRLSEGDGDWLLALKYITGESVTTPDLRGNFAAIRHAWAQWGCSMAMGRNFAFKHIEAALHLLNRCKIDLGAVAWTSDPTNWESSNHVHNCFGFVLDKGEWWEPPNTPGDMEGDPRFSWPDWDRVEYPASQRHSVERYTKVAEKEGFKRCDNDSWDEAFEKIVLIHHAGEFRHAALQVSATQWRGKLGTHSDFENPLSVLQNEDFGREMVFLQRLRRPRLLLGALHLLPSAS